MHLLLLTGGHILVLNELVFASAGRLMAIASSAVGWRAADTQTTFGMVFLASSVSTLNGVRVILQWTQGWSFTHSPWVIFLATAPATGRAANVGVVFALILSKSHLSLARVCGDLLPAIRRSIEALANQRVSNILDLMNFVLGCLSGCKDNRQEPYW